MPLEVATFVSGLVATNPVQSDPISAGDDHIRLLKAVLRNTFPNMSAAVTVTPAELNHLAGVTSAVQVQLNSKAAASHTHTEAEIADGNIFARLQASEVIPGSWNFTTRPLFNSSPLLHAGDGIPESSITDGTIFPRIAANETITGNWNFSTVPLFAGLGAWRWSTAGLTSGRVYLQSGGVPAATGTPGDIVLVY